MVNGHFTLDFHTHIFPEKIAAKAVMSLSERSGISPVSDGTHESLRRLMDAAGVDAAVLASVATKPEQARKINLFLSSLADERFVPFGAVHPLSEDACAEVEFVASLGFRGVKIHPDYQGFYADDERVLAVYEACARNGLAVLFHAGVDIGYPSPVHADPERLAKVAKMFPDCTFVCAHFGGWRMWDEVEKYLCQTENVYIDTAFCNGYISLGQAKRIVDKAGADRILLGSDCPWENPARSVELVLSLGLNEDETAAVLGGNAKRLLKLG